MGSCNGRNVETERGFSLLELTIAICIYTLVLGIGGIGFARTLASNHLISTRDALLWRLRFAQMQAYETDNFTWVNMDKYEPSYEVYDGWTMLGHYTFAKGIDYQDGYLQMQSGRIFYGVMGDSHSGGTIRLVDGHGDSSSIVLYLTSGLQAKGEMEHDVG